ncbi:MAG: hypothetical protein HY247_05785 [archaeon]|nr:MAG: hypothetical protein HY247_05785 [archaeon]
MCRATTLCCFKCAGWFDKEGVESCRTCGDWKCPHCGSCLCSLTLDGKKIAIAYMATYENLLRELTGESYDFGRHRRVLKEIGVGRKIVTKGRVS